jgi:hypothetical protein
LRGWRVGGGLDLVGGIDHRVDIDLAVDVLKEACSRLEDNLRSTRPELLDQPVEAIRPRRPRPGEMRRTG